MSGSITEDTIFTNIERLPVSREDLWKLLPKGMTIAEIGVWAGDYSTYILIDAEPETLYLVDIWDDTYRPNGLNMDRGPVGEYKKLLHHHRADDAVIMWRGTSEEFLKHVDSLDAVYIDASHSYEDTTRELEMSLQKVKRYIMGHDYHPNLPGVIRAVNEFAERHKLKFTLTNEVDGMYPSFVFCVEGK